MHDLKQRTMHYGIFNSGSKKRGLELSCLFEVIRPMAPACRKSKVIVCRYGPGRFEHSSDFGHETSLHCRKRIWFASCPIQHSLQQPGLLGRG